jgi:DNA-directed RNA polymerase subunit RPC12/RpoP
MTEEQENNAETSQDTINAGARQEESQQTSTSTKITLESLEQEAQDFMGEGGQFTSGYLSRGIGKYILFKKSAESLMKYGYKCPDCGHAGGGEIDMEKPYTITCEKCETEVFKQQKVKGKRKKRKKKE